MGALTIMSRVLGLARDVAQAAILGTGMAADAFTLAFIIPNTLRRLFGESTVSAAFVPTYTTSIVSGDSGRASRLGSGAINITAAALLLLTGIGMAFAPFLVSLFGPGFSAVPGKAALSTGLLRLLFPYILFVGTGAVLMGILNSQRHFVTPALGPVLFNICALAGLFLLASSWRPGEPVWGYSVGVLAGGLLQLVVQIPAMRRSGFHYTLTLGRGDRDLVSVGRLALPALFGLMVAEVNVMVDQVIASLLEPGSVAALSYGNRIMQFPLGVFAVALSTALLPTLSRQAALGRMVDARKTLGYASLGLSLLMVPATVFIAVLGRESVTVLMARGAFDPTSVDLTTAALVYFSLGLLFFGVVKVTAPVFYAVKDTRTPVMVAMACMGINIILVLVLAFVFAKTGFERPIAGVALASSISSALNVLFLRLSLRRRLGPGKGAPTASWIAMVPATAASLAGMLLLKPWVGGMVSDSTLRGALALAVAILACFALQFAVFAVAGGRSAVALGRFVLSRGRDRA
jgi:putative peptidoglycan lipid II flippase